MVDMDEFSATMNNVAVWYLALPLFPIFEIVHYFKVAMVARSEKGRFINQLLERLRVVLGSS